MKDRRSHGDALHRTHAAAATAALLNVTYCNAW